MSKTIAEYQYNITINPNYMWKYLKCTNAHMFERNLPDRKGRRKYFEMDKQSRAKMKNCFTWINLISDVKIVYSKKENKKFKFKLTFITLTLPAKQKQSDVEVKDKMLAPFLYWMKRYYYCNSYIWKAEVQKNNNLHFHIVSNKFIHWKSIRAKWNKICANHGYCKIFQDGSNDKGNASTQIKAVKRSKDITGYMLKYMSKNNDDRRPVEGRLWGASTNLNQTNMVIKETSGNYLYLEMNIEQLPFVKRITEVMNKITNEVELLPGTLYVWNKNIFKYLPITIREEFLERVKVLRKNDVPQKLIEVESIYN